MMKTVHLQYFAVLRERRGLGAETIASDARTLGELFRELDERYSFALPASQVRPAVGERFASMDDEWADGAHVVFIPPVAGG